MTKSRRRVEHIPRVTSNVRSHGVVGASEL